MEKLLVDKYFLEKLIDEVQTIEKISSYRSERIKNFIIEFLRKRSATAKEVSSVLHLSRNRCSEYLNLLEREGKLVSFRIGRKKYFKARI